MINPKPVDYNNTHFKSKLESEWAKWLDEKHIKWEYEQHKVDLYGKWYLPDFWLPEIRTIIEVKGYQQGIMKVFQLSQINYYDEGDWNNQHETVLVLMGGSPAPSIYDTHKTDYRLLKCTDCGKYSIITVGSYYKCRHCGTYLGGSPKNSPLLPKIDKPWSWPV